MSIRSVLVGAVNGHTFLSPPHQEGIMAASQDATNTSVQLDKLINEAVPQVTSIDQTKVAAIIDLSVQTVARCYRGGVVELRTYLAIVRAAAELGLPAPPKVVRVRTHARPRNADAPSSVYAGPNLTARSR